MVGRLFRSWFGNFEPEELKKFVLLAFIFGLTIGAYWLFRPLKDGVFRNIIGMDYQPLAKWFSLMVVAPLVILYGKLVDLFPRHRLFYALALIYSLLALVFGYFLMHPTIGLPNVNPDPWRIIGWLFYVYVESFGSLMVALFWAFASDTTTPESAKRGYPLMAAGAQLGGILGPLSVYLFAERVGTPILIGAGAATIFSIIPLIMYFMRVIPKEQLEGYKAGGEQPGEKKPKVGFAEGLKLMLSQPYLLGIFGVISLFEIVATIFDFRFKTFAQIYYKGEAFTTFMGQFGWITNLAALICILIGVNNIGRKLGLTISLVTLPVVVGGLVMANLIPNLYVSMFVVVIAKALNYALNQPSKEQLYIPTSKESRYKAKAWVEMFGSRGSKAAGSGINVFKKALGGYFVPFASVISLGLVGVWIMVALYLGRTHKAAVENNDVVC